MVYLWVDGADPKWLARKNAALASAGRSISKFAAGDNRYADHDELKYSLRSAQKFAPWINHIYIVTDGQTPKWLKKNPRITIVDHKDIIPAQYLPVFNSTAIECFLDRIPGLSEYFLFANDDMMFNADIAPDFFFDANGNPIVIVQEKWWPRSIFSAAKYNVGGRDTMFNNMFVNGLRLAYRKTGRRYGVFITHAIEPMRKSYLAQNLRDNWDEFAGTSITPFREKTNIQRIAYPLLDNAHGRNTLTLKRRPFGIRVNYHGRFPIFWHIIMLAGEIFGFAKTDIVDSPRNVIAKIRRRHPPLICIRDSDNVREMKAAQEYFDEVLPDKAPWEK